MTLHSLAWHGSEGWIACGGEEGLLRILRLDGEEAGPGAAMNQALSGHTGLVTACRWNEAAQKVTTTDSAGLTVVWVLDSGMWVADMRNEVTGAPVADLQWSSDGVRIALASGDGMVMVGTADGHKVWRELTGKSYTHVAWSPSGRLVLLASAGGQLDLHEAGGGAFIRALELPSDNDGDGKAVAAMDWFQGASDGPLAIALASGRVLIMRSEADASPVAVETHLASIARLAWNRDGSVLAVAGVQATQQRTSVVQFFSPVGETLFVLPMPGPAGSPGIADLAWSASSLKLALAVGSFIYIAHIRRQSSPWGYFASGTLVYGYAVPEDGTHALAFWNSNTNESWTKYVSSSIEVLCAAGEHCVLLSDGMLILYDAIGTPLDSRQPALSCVRSSAMTRSHVVLASERAVYVWHFAARAAARDEYLFAIDDDPAETASPVTADADERATSDSVVALAASDTALLVARESGELVRYVLPHVAREARYRVPCRPTMLALNCTSTRAALVDLAGRLGFLGLDEPADEQRGVLGLYRDGGRGSVWSVLWSRDDADLCAVMEKAKLVVLRGEAPEEPVPSSAYLASFDELVVCAVDMDAVLANPEYPDRQHIQSHETHALRQTREMVTRSLADARAFVAERPHPRLWRLLAEAALEQLDLGAAHAAFQAYGEYRGILFVRRLAELKDPAIQRAEVAAHFGDFDAAEAALRALDRADLAVAMRLRYGDWFRVLKLLPHTGGDDALTARAQVELGDYYAERGRWDKALPYYARAHAAPQLMAACFATESYDRLPELVDSLPHGDALLGSLGEQCAAVGLVELATEAFLRLGDPKRALATCVAFHQCGRALELAQAHRLADDNSAIDSQLSTHADNLLAQGRLTDAVLLYNQAQRPGQAGALLMRLAEDAAARGRVLRAKKLYVLAGMSLDRADGAPEPERAWRGAQACHLFLLAQRQLHAGQHAAALISALRAREFNTQTALASVQVNALVALAALAAKQYGTCSRAFIALESAADASPETRTAVQALADEIFTRVAPRDKSQAKPLKCPACHDSIEPSAAECNACEKRFPVCMATGKTLWNEAGAWRCKVCKQLTEGALSEACCPLCHASRQGAEGM